MAGGFVSLDVACTDGTKMEANANRYTFVWGKSIHTRISKIAEQLEEIWQYAESVTKQELRDSALSHIRISSRRKWKRHSGR